MSSLLEAVESSANPFSPDFGQPPETLVGRESLLSDLRSGLATGPRDAGFTSLLMGQRGSGKTVVLTEMEDIASTSGWIVVSVDAATDGLLDRITESIALARDSCERVGASRSGTASGSRWSGAIRLGPFEWHENVFQQVQPDWSLRQQLTELAESASSNATAVLVTVDEIHSGDRRELRRLAGDVQHITKRARLPLAFLGAGLSHMKHTLLADKKMTFFQRCIRHDMPPLTTADARRGLQQTVHSAGGVIQDEALTLAAESAGTLPYRLQLVGHNAWNIAGAPQHPIDIIAAREAKRLAEQQMTERISVPAWHDLDTTEQAFLKAVAGLGDDAFPAEITRSAEISARRLAQAEQRLATSGYIRETSDGTLTLTDLIPAAVVTRMTAAEARFQPSLSRPPADQPPNHPQTTP